MATDFCIPDKRADKAFPLPGQVAVAGAYKIVTINNYERNIR